MEDNFYKASTERLITPPIKQQERLQQEKNAFERERPLVTKVIKSLEKEISTLEKVDSIQHLDDPEACMREIAVNKRVCQILRRELNQLEVKAKMFDNEKSR